MHNCVRHILYVHRRCHVTMHKCIDIKLVTIIPSQYTEKCCKQLNEDGWHPHAPVCKNCSQKTAGVKWKCLVTTDGRLCRTCVRQVDNWQLCIAHQWLIISHFVCWTTRVLQHTATTTADARVRHFITVIIHYKFTKTLLGLLQQCLIPLITSHNKPKFLRLSRFISYFIDCHKNCLSSLNNNNSWFSSRRGSCS